MQEFLFDSILLCKSATNLWHIMSRDVEQIILSASNFLRSRFKTKWKTFADAASWGGLRWAKRGFYAGDNELPDVKLIVK